MRTISFIFCHFLIQVIQELIHDILYSSGLTYFASKNDLPGNKKSGWFMIFVETRAKLFEPYFIRNALIGASADFYTFAH